MSGSACDTHMISADSLLLNLALVFRLGMQLHAVACSNLSSLVDLHSGEAGFLTTLQNWGSKTGATKYQM